MKLRAGYNNSKANETSDLMLVLNFNDVDDHVLEKIVDKVYMFVEKNLHCENCYYYLCDCQGTKNLKKFDIPYKAVKEGPCSIGAMILPDKRLLKKALDAPYILCDLNKLPQDECGLAEYFNNEEIRYCTHTKIDDFKIDFERKNWDDNFSFECVVGVNGFSVENNYESLVQLYQELIKQMSEEFNLFAAYIDFDGFAEGALMYEYCYGVQTNVDRFEILRTIPWGAYVSNGFLEMNQDFLTEIKQALVHKKTIKGLFFHAPCEIEKYNRKQRKSVYNVLKKFLPKSYSIMPVNCMIASGFRPCEDIAYLFEELGNKYVVFSNGVDIDEIKDIERQQFFRYVKTIYFK